MGRHSTHTPHENTSHLAHGHGRHKRLQWTIGNCTMHNCRGALNGAALCSDAHPLPHPIVTIPTYTSTPRNPRLLVSSQPARHQYSKGAVSLPRPKMRSP